MSSTSQSTQPAARSGPARKKITLPTLQQKKRTGETITMLTAYDFPTALAVDECGVDVILVGDSLGMVVLGHPNTLSVTMDEMLHHCRAVSRGARLALLVGDMPFMSYQASTSDAVRNAGRFLQEAGMDAVKLEGGRERVTAIRAIADAGIPVMGHLGLTPQSFSQLGGFRPQARTGEAAAHLAEDAQRLQEAGCFSIVLESVPDRLAAWISKRLEIPVIGIGAGIDCDGQVLVSHDVLGLFHHPSPRFAKEFGNLRKEMTNAFSAYLQEVRQRSFPTPQHSVGISDEEWTLFQRALDAPEIQAG